MNGDVEKSWDLLSFEAFAGSLDLELTGLRERLLRRYGLHFAELESLRDEVAKLRVDNAPAMMNGGDAELSQALSAGDVKVLAKPAAIQLAGLSAASTVTCGKMPHPPVKQPRSHDCGHPLHPETDEHLGRGIAAEAYTIPDRWGALSRLLLEAPPPSQDALFLHHTWMDPPSSKLKKKNSVTSETSIKRLSMGDCLVDETNCFQRCVINPNGSARLSWVLIGMLFILWDMLVIPMQMFDLGSFEQAIEWLTYITFTYWLMDVPGNFFTGVDVGGVTEMRPPKIAKLYLKGWFILDIIVLLIDVALFSVDAALAGSDSTDNLQPLRLARSLRLFRLVRLVRAGKLANSIEVVFNRFRDEYLILAMKTGKGLTVIVTVNHFFACAWYGIGLQYFDGRSWLMPLGLEASDFSVGYASALHWSLTQFMPATNNVGPTNAQERIFAIFVVLIALIGFSSYIGSILGSINELRATKAEERKRQAFLRRFMNEHTVSTQLWVSTQEFLRHREKYIKSQKKLTEDKVLLIREMPESLQIRIHIEIYNSWLTSAFWFPTDLPENRENDFAMELCHLAMGEATANKMDELFNPGSDCPRVLIITEGTLSYHDPGNTHKWHLGRETWIGEMSLWFPWHHRGKLVAEAEVNYVTLDSKKFRSIASAHGNKTFAYLKTFGILLSAYAEDAEEEGTLNDLLLQDDHLTGLAQRALRFIEVSSNIAP